MKLKKLVTIVILTLSSSVYATNGYWSHGYGAKSKSIAGACVAMAFGSMCAASNPASLVRVGNRMDYGLSLFAPSRGFTANDDASPVGPPMGPASIPANQYDSGNDFFLIPHFAYNRLLDENSSIGIAIGGNGGMNTEYDSPIFQNFGNPMNPSSMPSSTTGIDLTQMFIGITYSRKINEKHSFGITPILAIQSIEVKGLQPFKSFSLYPDKVTNNDHDFAYGGGFRFGWFGQITDRISLGASYQTKLKMTKFEEYKGLFAEEGSFDSPVNYDLGFAIKITPELLFAFDYQRIEYGDINAMSNPSDLVFMPGQILLGTDDGLGFGWEDMDIFKFGVQWQYSSDLTLRAGYSHANNPFPNTQALFNTLAPAVIRTHYTFGFSVPLSGQNEFNVGVTYAPNEKIHGMNRNTGPQTGFVEMDQLEITIGWGVKF
ncbi:MAG: outer membrane protein transport protein [Proteobacteria bacterium]|nr:outer membrane protein transport protein [Pseudomonadota bacterium]